MPKMKVEKGYCNLYLRHSSYIAVCWYSLYPSVLWHWWLGHVTRKIVSEMTYNVSSGTLNPTIPYLYVTTLAEEFYKMYMTIMWREKTRKVKLKVWTLAIAPLTWVRLVTSSALQSRKWQLIGMSQWWNMINLILIPRKWTTSVQQ